MTAEAHYLDALEALDAEKREEALQHARKAVKLDPEHADAWRVISDASLPGSRLQPTLKQAASSLSAARNYTTNRDPIDIGIADFNCDGHNDMAVATDGTHTITILLNDGTGDFTDRYDVWVSQNTSRNAEWDEFSNVQFLEVGEFTGDSAPDIAIFQRNNPFKTDDNGAPAGEPGNLTILENDGCNSDSFTIGQRYTHFWAWDLAVGDINQDGNDDVVILDLLNDISNQRVVTYLGPITSPCTLTTCYTTALGPASTAAYRDLEVGDWGEADSTLT